LICARARSNTAWCCPPAISARDARDEPLQQPPRPAILQRAQQPWQRFGQCLGGRARLAAVGQEAADDPGHVQPLDQPPHLGLGEDVARDEVAEAAPEPFLLAGDDRGVRDGQPHRPAEQCGDRKPVREPADDARLRRGRQQVGPEARLEAIGQHGERDHEEKQGGREGAVPREGPAQPLVRRIHEPRLPRARPHWRQGGGVLPNNIMRRWLHPLDLAAGVAERLAWALGLAGVLWLAILWAMAA
jgi:hypothetical protein